MADLTMQTPVRFMAGVGEKRAEQLAKLGITDVRSLLYHLPRAYQHRGDVRLLSEAEDGQVASFLLTVSKEPTNTRIPHHKNMTLTKLRAFDDSMSCAITYFNQPYVKDNLKLGATYRFWGKASVNGSLISLNSPEYEPWYEGLTLPEFTPVYRVTSGISNKYITKLISTALESVTFTEEDDVLPPDIRKRANVLCLYEAFGCIHRPSDYKMMDSGRRRFVFEQLYTFALAVTLSRTNNDTRKAPVIAGFDLNKFARVLPFALTEAQVSVIKDVARDVGRDTPMKRMITGDVGCGKTVCAAACAYMAMSCGYQAAIMAPTSILATQHYNDLSELFGKLGYKCELLVGSTTAKEKKRIYADLASGELKLVIGTHALLSEGVEFNNPGVFITDEQHRFGVMQRAQLSRKGSEGEGLACHTLVMTATPIPRSLALVLYGDLALSRINQMPAGRQKVDTFAVGEGYRARLNNFIAKQVRNGNQVYIVCPSIQEQEKDEDDSIGDIVGIDYRGDDEVPKLKSAAEYAENLQKNVFPDLKVALVHGKMKQQEKEATMSAFAKGEIDILVSTTVIEVGVNVPNATLMIVENAERFGLAQLHQLRGRVGRGSAKSYCVLVSDSKSPTSIERLKTMCDTTDGFKIAEADLELRGPGDYFATEHGARQHGIGMDLTSICNDMSDLNFAFEAAKTTLASDPKLTDAKHTALSRYVHNITGRATDTIS